MLASVLKSSLVIQVNICIIKVFLKIREMIMTHFLILRLLNAAK
jgi:hypothetical protein